MNANDIINDDMTLDEKMAAIQKALWEAQKKSDEEAKAKGRVSVPVDPASLTICDGCE